MIRVLAFTLDPTDGAAQVRIDPLRHMQQHGFPIDVRVSTNPTYEDIAACDLFYNHRAHNRDHLTHILNAKRLGKKIWTDLDDDLLGVPIDHFAYPSYASKDVQESIILSLQLSDVVTFSNPYMVDKYGELNKNHSVIPCAYDERYFIPLRRIPIKPRPKKILWRGSPTHMKSLMEFAPFIQEVEKRHEGWEWHFIGANPYPWWIYDKFSPGTKVVCTPWIEPMQFLRHISDLQPAVQFVAHTDCSFTRCRSQMSYLDATFAGAVCLAPNWEHWREPGVVTYNDKEEFVNKFDNLLTAFETGIVDYKETVELSWNHICDRFTMKHWNERRAKIINSLFPGG